MFLTDIVVGGVTAHVVPEEVPEDWDEGVVELRHGETVLALQVVGLSLGPVEPLHGLVSGGPEPLTRVVLTVTLLQDTKSNMQQTFFSSSGNILAFKYFPASLVIRKYLYFRNLH